MHVQFGLAKAVEIPNADNRLSCDNRLMLKKAVICEAHEYREGLCYDSTLEMTPRKSVCEGARQTASNGGENSLEPPPSKEAKSVNDRTLNLWES